MTEIQYNAYTENGKLKIRNTKGFVEELSATFPNVQNLEIIVRKKRKGRSAAQNRLWWLYMNIMSKELGYTKDEMHSICGCKFLMREKVNEDTGEVLPYIESTTKLTTVQFMELVDELVMWAAEVFSIRLPLPEEQIEINL